MPIPSPLFRTDESVADVDTFLKGVQVWNLAPDIAKRSQRLPRLQVFQPDRHMQMRMSRVHDARLIIDPGLASWQVGFNVPEILVRFIREEQEFLQTLNNRVQCLRWNMVLRKRQHDVLHHGGMAQRTFQQGEMATQDHASVLLVAYPVVVQTTAQPQIPGQAGRIVNQPNDHDMPPFIVSVSR